MQTIRRYANRKLYHLEEHRYVNLADIAAMIRDGKEVQVQEHPGGRDLTTEVLAQIIALERPASLASSLMALIRWGGTSLAGAGRLFQAHAELPAPSQWERLEEQIARLEVLVQQLVDGHSDEML